MTRPEGPASGGDIVSYDVASRESVGAGFRQTDLATSVTSYLVAGPTTFGLMGWALERWTGWLWWVPIGIIGGMALALYVIWLRYAGGGER